MDIYVRPRLGVVEFVAEAVARVVRWAMRKSSGRGRVGIRGRIGSISVRWVVEGRRGCGWCRLTEIGEGRENDRGEVGRDCFGGRS